MASGAKDIQLRELKDTISQLKTMMSEQTELIKSLRLIIEEKSNHEKVLQEQIDYLTKNSSVHPVKKDPVTFRASRIFSMKLKWNRIRLF
jgi:type II secretory pathway component PulF